MSESGNPQTVEIPGVPNWAINLVQTVAEIRVKVDSIPHIERELDELRKAVVPLKEHEELMRRVDDLWDTKSQLVPQWEDTRPRIDTMWDERAQIRGILRAQRWLMALMGFGITILAAWLTVRTYGARLYGP